MQMMQPFGAVARLEGNAQNPRLRGTVRFQQQQNGVLVTAHVTGLPNTATDFFAFHIHEGNNCRGRDFSGSGMHYNRDRDPHPEHAGDLPPLLSCNGTAYLSVLTNRFRLCDILGRTVVIHRDPDDFETQPGGDSGKKIACGVIRRA